MNSILAAGAFGTAAALAATEIVRAQRRRLVIQRARQQVGLVPIVESDRRRRWNSTTINLIVIGVIAGVLGLITVGPAGALLGAIPVMSFRSWESRRARKRREALADQLAPALQLVVGHLRIGRKVMSALAEVAEDTPAPLGDLLREVVSEVRLGSAVDAVIARLTGR